MFARKIGFSAAKCCSLAHIELKVNKTLAYVRHSLPVSGDINLVDLGHFSREKNYFSFVFIKFLFPIRNKYIMSYKKTRKYFSVHIHFKNPNCWEANQLVIYIEWSRI